MDIVERLRATSETGADPDTIFEAADEIDRLRNALRLVMACAGDIDKATDADLESALECGDAETEKQANAWLVARAALPQMAHPA